MALESIISGGQTGVDRGAIDAALGLGFPCGGTCPKGRRAEDGVIPDHYPFTESTEDHYRARTEANISNSDATLILAFSLPLEGGTRLTQELAVTKRSPFLIQTLPWSIQEVLDWLVATDVKRLNVAGPRESGAPGIWRATFEFLSELLKSLS
jgi:hypothetical protein